MNYRMNFRVLLIALCLIFVCQVGQAQPSSQRINGTAAARAERGDVKEEE